MTTPENSFGGGDEATQRYAFYEHVLATLIDSTRQFRVSGSYRVYEQTLDDLAIFETDPENIGRELNMLVLARCHPRIRNLYFNGELYLQANPDSSAEEEFSFTFEPVVRVLRHVTTDTGDPVWPSMEEHVLPDKKLSELSRMPRSLHFNYDN